MSEKQADVFSLEEIKNYIDKYEEICEELKIREKCEEETGKPYDNHVYKTDFFMTKVLKRYAEVKNDDERKNKIAEALKLFLIVENSKKLWNSSFHRNNYLDRVLTEEERRKIENRLNGIIAEDEKKYIEKREEERKRVEKEERKRVEEPRKEEEKQKILKIEKVGGKNEIYICRDMTNCDYNEEKDIINIILKSINNEYELGKSLGSGFEGEIIRIKKGFVAKVYYKGNNNDNIYKNLNGIKTGSTAPINVLEIIDKNGKKITIEIYKERKKNLQKALEENEVAKASVIDYLIRNFKVMHASGIIHRDIKALNILVDDNGKVSTADYGLAINSEIKKVAGTYPYMAPELFYGGKATVKSDVYSFGTVLLDIFTKGNDFFYNFLLKKLVIDNKGAITTQEELFNCLKEFFSKGKNIADLIEEKDIDLTNFLPRNIIDDNSEKNEEKKKQLRIKILDLIKHTTAMNPKDRPTMDGVEKEWEEIKDFIQKEFGINKEDLLFLDKLNPENKTQIPKDEQETKKQQEVRNKASYVSKVFTKDNIKTETNKLKNSLGKVLKRKVEEDNIGNIENNTNELNEEDDIDEEEIEVLYDQKKGIGNLEEALKKISEEERPLSENANKCIAILNECIDENNNVTLPDESFYELCDTLRDNIEEYLMVMDKLIKLRELKLAIEIERLEEIENNIDKDNEELEKDLKRGVEKLREFRMGVTTTTRTYDDGEMARRLFVISKYLTKELLGKELELRDIDKKMKDVYMNLICDKETEHPELIPILLDRIEKEEDKEIVVNQIFDKAYKDNSPKILGTLLTNEETKEIIDQKVNNNYNDYIKIAIKSGCKDLAKVLIKNVFYSSFKRLENNEKTLEVNKESLEKNRKNLKQLCKELKINKSKLKKFNKDLKNIEKNETIESKKYEGLIGELNSLLGLDQQHSK